MKIVMTLLVRDEEDVLTENIDFHLDRGVDFIIATDNLSVDGTAEILHDYARRGVLRYIHEAEDTYSQATWVTRMARLAATDHGADWVINNDADEFWWPRSGTLRDVFTAVPAETGVVQVPRHDFVAVEGEGPFFDRMVWREVVSLNALGRPLPPKVAHRAACDVVVAQGNHSVEGVRPPGIGTAGLEILHFPLRSPSQFTNKITKGGAAYARNAALPPHVGGTWRKLFAELRSDGSLERHLAASIHRADRIARRILAGEIVEDRRLADFLGAGSHSVHLASSAAGQAGGQDG